MSYGIAHQINYEIVLKKISSKGKTTNIIQKMNFETNIIQKMKTIYKAKTK